MKKGRLRIICDALHVLDPIVQFKNVKNTYGGVLIFSKVAG